MKDYEVMLAVERACAADENLCLDVVDGLLQMTHGRLAADLSVILELGGSVWQVGPDGTSLSQRVDAAASQQSTAALAPADAASLELSEAWSNAFGRQPDASDAWDHAIKAVEEALKPIITPNNPGATLGAIIGQIRSQPTLYKMTLQDNGLNSSVDPIAALEQMLHFIWPNPDRHGGADKRTPSITEGQAVVQFAVTVVQWARNGVISAA